MENPTVVDDDDLLMKVDSKNAKLSQHNKPEKIKALYIKTRHA